MANLQYIGARYVPKFYLNPDDGTNDWKSGVAYEPLTVVLYQNDSYTSKIPVPASVGVPSDNPSFWAKTGNFNAALEALQNEVGAVDSFLGDRHLETDASDVTGAINELNSKIDDITDKVVFMPNFNDDGYSKGNGDCTVFISENPRKVVMYDSGRAEDYAGIRETLEALKITFIDVFILSHYHGDHYINIDSLKADGYITDDTIAYLPRFANIVPGWDVVQPEVTAKFSQVVTISSIKPLRVGNFKFEFFNCDQSDFDHYELLGLDNGNNYSNCCYVTNQNTRILMTGDIGYQVIDYNAGLNKFKQCDILKVPHHGITSGGDNKLFLLTRPTYAVTCAAKIFNSIPANVSDPSAVVSEKSQYLNAMGIPDYITGYGAIVVGIGDSLYSLFPNNGVTIESSRNQYADFPLYVDATFTGIEKGTTTQPFKTIKGAIAYAKEIKAINSVTINIVGAYNAPDEEIDFTGFNRLNLVATQDNGTNQVSVKQLVFFTGTYDIKYVDVVGAVDKAIDIRNNAFVILENSNITGDVSTESGASAGRGIYVTNDGSINARGCTVSNKNIALFAERDGDIEVASLHGSNNNCLLSGDGGGNANLSGTIDITYTEYLRRVNTSRPPYKYVLVDNKTGFCGNSPFITYRASHSALTTDVISLQSAVYNSKLFLVYVADGSIWQFNKMSGSNFTTPTQVQAPIDAALDPNFAISISGNDVSITFESWVHVVAI